MNRILISGNLGYVGAALTKYLRKKYPNAYLIGFDNAYFASCLTGDVVPESLLNEQHYGDVRYNSDGEKNQKFYKLCRGVDSIIHLCAISNDPIGRLNEKFTFDINTESSIRLAKWAKYYGVKNFVFASSCSVYGFAENGEELNEESKVNPLTSYAKSKVKTEEGLKELADNNFKVTCLRFATACGWSDRTRLDLVVNDFVASALTTGEIHIQSNGKPWRPIIDVQDMARAMDWAMNRTTGENFEIVNAGGTHCNYTVAEIANKVKEKTGAKVFINNFAPEDKRSYKVSFKKLTDFLNKEANNGNFYWLDIKIEQSIDKLIEGLDNIKYEESQKSNLIRLDKIIKLQEQGLLNNNLEWIR